jgi:hypothetical protein
MQERKTDYQKPILFVILAIVLIGLGNVYVIGSEINDCTKQYTKTTAIYQAWITDDKSMTDDYGNAGSDVPRKNILSLLSQYNDNCGHHKLMVFTIPDNPYDSFDKENVYDAWVYQQGETVEGESTSP